MMHIETPTVEVVREAVEILREGDVVLGDGDWDYLAADMLEILAALHDETGIDLDGLPQVRYFAECVVEVRG